MAGNEEMGKEIAKAALEIGAITLNPDNPYTWASGFRMPIYNDNRKLLAEHRKLVGSGLAALAQPEDFDFIAGTSTAGIAPAATVSQLFGVPQLLMEGGKPYSFDDDRIVDLCYNLTTKSAPANGSDVIASTCPWSIPIGVFIANKLDKPFIYVRQSVKDHGLKQQIEGKYNPGQKVFLVDFNNKESYLVNAITAIEKSGLAIGGVFSRDIDVPEVKIEGRNVLVVEDLVSTGGSSVAEVAAYRAAGAKVDRCISIFNYGFAEAREMFAGKRDYDKNGNRLSEPCGQRSLLEYNVLLETARDMGKVNAEQIKMLEEWRAEPFEWGEKHGFPKVEKKK